MNVNMNFHNTDWYVILQIFKIIVILDRKSMQSFSGLG